MSKEAKIEKFGAFDAKLATLHETLNSECARDDGFHTNRVYDPVNNLLDINCVYYESSVIARKTFLISDPK